LKQIVTENHIKLRNILNMDEKGFMMETICADGTSLDSMIIGARNTQAKSGLKKDVHLRWL